MRPVWLPLLRAVFGIVTCSALAAQSTVHALVVLFIAEALTSG